MPESNGTARLDRIERALELLIDDHVQFREEHKQLLTAQVVLTDRLDKLTGRLDQLAQAQIHTDEKIAELADKLNGLIGYVAGFPRPPQA
jgi:chromosome segregation ATPase